MNVSALQGPLVKGGWQRQLTGGLQSLRLPFGQPPPFHKGGLGANAVRPLCPQQGCNIKGMHLRLVPGR